jgi:hypothetical protein
MKKQLIAMILALMLVTPPAAAERTYGGLSVGQVAIGDIDTGNLGITFGSIAENGFGLELFFSLNVIDQDEKSGGSTYKAEADTIGLFLVYQTPGSVYFKGRAGYGIVNLTFDLDDDGASVNDNVTGLSYGVAGGMMIGDGALELTYYWFPDFDDYADLNIDNQHVNMINLTYFWHF